MRRNRFMQHRGFSLIEMLVALVFISLLMAGMLRVFASSMNTLSTATEVLGANRTKRWAITQLEDDLQSVGYFYYHPFRTLPGYVSVDTSSGQNALMLFPNQSTATYKSADTATNQLTDEKVWFDEFQYLEDQPIPVQAQLSASPTANNVLTLTVTAGTLADVRAGDFMMILDQTYEVGKVLSTSGSTVTLDTTQSAIQDQVDGSGTGASPGLKTLTHQPGTSVFFVRPLQVVRYTVMPLALDPAYPLASVPCLVRDQGPYPTTGARITWPAANAAMPAGYTRTVIAENVAGQPATANPPTVANQFALRVDLSLDNGTTWHRTGAATWTAVATNLNSWLATNGQPGFQSVTDSNNPIWFRNIPALFRLDVSVRTPVMRTDPNNPTQRAYTYRSQTLMCQPRNFSNGL